MSPFKHKKSRHGQGRAPAAEDALVKPAKLQDSQVVALPKELGTLQLNWGLVL